MSIVRCSVGDCPREHHCRGMCKRHYERWREGPQFVRKEVFPDLKTASYETRIQWLTPAVLILLAERVSEEHGCWVWRGGTDGHGYGVFGALGAKWRATRAFYEVFVGPIAAGLYVCHRCDNPPCVNPGHLFLGTQTDNMRDCSAKGRVKPALTQRGERHHFARVTDQQIAEAVAIYRAGGITQKALADRYGVRQATVWGWIHGRTRRGAA